MTARHYVNPRNDRKYVLEYGDDLFGNFVVTIRYGIALGICKHYLFATASEQLDKIRNIDNKRLDNGYQRLS